MTFIAVVVCFPVLQLPPAAVKSRLPITNHTSVHRGPEGRPLDASRQNLFRKGVWIYPGLKFKSGLLFYKALTIPPSQTFHELIEWIKNIWLESFYTLTGKSLLCLTLLISCSSCGQCSQGQPTSWHQPGETISLLLTGVSSSATEPAKHGLQRDFFKPPHCLEEQTDLGTDCTQEDSSAEVLNKLSVQFARQKTLSYVTNQPPAPRNFGPT